MPTSSHLHTPCEASRLNCLDPQLHSERIEHGSGAPPLEVHPDTARRVYDSLVAQVEDFATAVDFGTFLGSFNKLRLNVAELVGMRLHTGPMFVFFNTVLRARGRTVDWDSPAGRYPVRAGSRVDGRFVTTIHSIASGVLKLCQLQPAVTVYRGAGGFKMPQQLQTPDAFGSRYGTEFGFLSTTMDPAVARQYGETKPLAVFQFRTIMVGARYSRRAGMCIECRARLGPGTGLELRL